MTPRRRVLVVGVGNPECGDDGAGPWLAALLADRLPDGAAVRIRTADMLALVDDCAGCDAMVCIDCAVSGAAPGTVHRIDLAAAAPLPPSPNTWSSHGFGLGEALGLARALGRLPTTVTVYAIEGCAFAPGDVMTPAVRQAASALAESIVVEVGLLLMEPGAAVAR